MTSPGSSSPTSWPSPTIGKVPSTSTESTTTTTSANEFSPLLSSFRPKKQRRQSSSTSSALIRFHSEHQRRLSWTQVFAQHAFVPAAIVLSVLLGASFLMPLVPHFRNDPQQQAVYDTSSSGAGRYNNPQQHAQSGGTSVPTCPNGRPCFHPDFMQVSKTTEGFPSYWNYAGPMNVTADGRSFLLDGRRALFLSGSMHPVRATRATWESALDEAVRNGLNMITVYVMWGAHQPFPNSTLDFSMPLQQQSNNHNSQRWDVAASIQSAANRGLFVHIRIGPYTCAEYQYGGIPEWLALEHPDMALRRPNGPWIRVMREYVTKTISYLQRYKLFAYQGGPIVMAQIENELAANVEDDTKPSELLLVDREGKFVSASDESEEEEQERLRSEQHRALRKATLQDYADWCGDLASELAPNVIWTMCNGLSANNTISTFNGVYGGGWLESNGDTGRIQVDQPAIWTEAEGGFQLWGEDPLNPSDYFWGRTARDVANSILRWFARGGSHVNYYMWFGGYNRQRSAAASISNAYATEVPLCPNGQRRQPKFDHLGALHATLADIAPVLLHAPSALHREQAVEVMDAIGEWVVTTEKQRQFVYEFKGREAMFVENDDLDARLVRVKPKQMGASATAAAAGGGGGGGGCEPLVFEMQAQSSVLIVNGMVAFDSAAILRVSQSYKRHTVELKATLLDWVSWREPTGGAGPGQRDHHPGTEVGDRPREQTALNVHWMVSSDYAWYETDFTMEGTDDVSSATTLFVDTQKASAIVAYVDGIYAGGADNHEKSEGNVTLPLSLGHVSPGWHRLALLSESLGYSNLIGRWGASVHAKTKGITGDVTLVTYSSRGAGAVVQSLVDGRPWRSFAGLRGERLGDPKDQQTQQYQRVVRRKDLAEYLESGRPSRGLSPRWSSAYFDTPRYDHTNEALFLQITTGRGHLWLNGNDLGRYWNITSQTTSEAEVAEARAKSTASSMLYTQEYYFLPNDFLFTNGKLNELVLFDAYGGDHRESKLVLSWITPSDKPNMVDEIGFRDACI